MARKKEVGTLEDAFLHEGESAVASEVEQVVETVQDIKSEKEVETEAEFIKIQYLGNNPSFTIGKIRFTQGSINELPRNLAYLALKNKGFKRVK